MNDFTTVSQRADEHEAKMSRELDYLFVKSRLHSLAEGDLSAPPSASTLMKGNPNARMSMVDDPRLPKMPDKPTLFDFFRLRFGPSAHLLQSARLAMKNGVGEKVVLACLLHDIAIAGFIRSDHGYWSAQLLEPYVDEEVAWGIRYHQALRFFPDESVGYKYPELYLKLFGADYVPEPHIQEAYRYARDHKWYMTSRLITVNDLYSFDPTVKVELEEFTDVVGRHFRQPKEGLGFDQSPAAHMWRTINWPTRYL